MSASSCPKRARPGLTTYGQISSKNGNILPALDHHLTNSPNALAGLCGARPFLKEPILYKDLKLRGCFNYCCFFVAGIWRIRAAQVSCGFRFHSLSTPASSRILKIRGLYSIPMSIRIYRTSTRLPPRYSSLKELCNALWSANKEECKAFYF